MNPIINRLKAKTEEIGLEAAALYYSGEGPGKKISPAQLQKVMDDQEMPTPRMCLKVCEDLEALFNKADKLAWNLGETNAMLEQKIGAYGANNKVLRAENENFALDNANLLTRIRILESQAVANSGLAAQGFGIVQPFNPVPFVHETPVAVQPWAAGNVNGVAVAPESPFTEITD